MNCDLNLEQDIKDDGVIEEIKKLSEKSWLLLEKVPAYQNDIKIMYLWQGVPGTTLEKVSFGFLLSTANINRLSWHYKFYDVEEKKIMDCKIYSPYDQFINRSLKVTNRYLTYTVVMKVYMDQVTTEFLYKRYLFDFNAVYQDRNLFFVLDPEQDEFISSDPDYHYIVNDRFMRHGK